MQLLKHILTSQAISGQAHEEFQFKQVNGEHLAYHVT